MTCQYEKVSARVSVSNPRDNKEDPETGYRATIAINCAICKKPFEFLGVSPEPSSDRPMVAHDGVELRLPVAPKGERLEEGLLQ